MIKFFAGFVSGIVFLFLFQPIIGGIYDMAQYAYNRWDTSNPKFSTNDCLTMKNSYDGPNYVYRVQKVMECHPEGHCYGIFMDAECKAENWYKTCYSNRRAYGVKKVDEDGTLVKCPEKRRLNNFTDVK